MFFGGFLPLLIKLQPKKKGTVIWPSQMTEAFFSVVICNLIEEPAEKYSDKPAVFCAASKTIRCSRVSPYLIFWKIKIMSYVFWWVPAFVDQITTGKKRYSRLAIPDDCTFFFFVVICNLIEESAKKYSGEPAKTIRHCNQWPDDCTFFFGRNLIEEPAKTIQAHGTPKHSNSQITVCRAF